MKEKFILKCSNVFKNYDFYQILRNITFSIEKNTIFGILGANGAGKTTLIKILTGLIKPNNGDVEIFGLKYSDNREKIKKYLNYVPDSSFLYQELTIYENLKFYENLYYNYNNKKISEKIEYFTKLFKIEDWIQEPVKNLSRGMKRKVEIIRSLISDPKILFMDEPFSGLDFNTTKTLISQIINLKKNEGLTVVITTHNIGIATEVCDEVIILKKGKINKSIDKEKFEGTDLTSFY